MPYAPSGSNRKERERERERERECLAEQPRGQIQEQDNEITNTTSVIILQTKKETKLYTKEEVKNITLICV
jgi:hypothetical protein